MSVGAPESVLPGSNLFESKTIRFAGAFKLPVAKLGALSGPRKGNLGLFAVAGSINRAPQWPGGSKKGSRQRAISSGMREIGV